MTKSLLSADVLFELQCMYNAFDTPHPPNTINYLIPLFSCFTAHPTRRSTSLQEADMGSSRMSLGLKCMKWQSARAIWVHHTSWIHDPSTGSTGWCDVEKQCFPQIEAYRGSNFSMVRLWIGVLVLCLYSIAHYLPTGHFAPTFDCDLKHNT